METPAQTCARIITALEDLAAQEAAALETRDFTAAITIQDRAAPLVEHLATYAGEITDPALRARIAAVHARRDRTGEWLAEQISRVRQQLHDLEAGQRRVAQVAPAYGRGAGASRQLCAVG